MALENPAAEEDSWTEERDQAKPSSRAGMPLTGLERTGAPILGHPDLPDLPPFPQLHLLGAQLVIPIRFLENVPHLCTFVSDPHFHT